MIGSHKREYKNISMWYMKIVLARIQVIRSLKASMKKLSDSFLESQTPLAAQIIVALWLPVYLEFPKEPTERIRGCTE